jgi:hypothetical protein
MTEYHGPGRFGSVLRGPGRVNAQRGMIGSIAAGVQAARVRCPGLMVTGAHGPGCAARA